MTKLYLSIVMIFTLSIVNAQQRGERKSKLTKNGFYVESVIGTANLDLANTNTAIGGGLKLGNVWYFGNNEVWKPGVKTVWFRGTTYFGNDQFMLQGSVANIGFANIIKFTENLGLEANLNLGYNVVYNSYDYSYYDYDYDYYYSESSDVFAGGVIVNPEVKFRYNVLAVGLDFVFSKVKEFDEDYDNRFNFSAIHLSVGAKF